MTKFQKTLLQIEPETPKYIIMTCRRVNEVQPLQFDNHIKPYRNLDFILIKNSALPFNWRYNLHVYNWQKPYHSKVKLK